MSDITTEVIKKKKKKKHLLSSILPLSSLDSVAPELVKQKTKSR